MTSPDDLGSAVGGREVRAPRSPRWSGWLHNRTVRTSFAAATAGAIAVVALLGIHSPQARVEPVGAPPWHLNSTSQLSSSDPSSLATTAPDPTTTPPASPSATPGIASTLNQSTVPVQHLGWTLRIDALGLVARIDGMRTHDGVVDPPTHDAAYWLSEYGAPSTTATNTAYLVGHSWSRGPAVFNDFTDAASQQSRIPVGTTIVVVAGAGPLTYVVDATARYAKTQLTTTRDVWAVVPGRLVLITCFLHAGVDRSPENFVVYAHLVTPGG